MRGYGHGLMANGKWIPVSVLALALAACGGGGGGGGGMVQNPPPPASYTPPFTPTVANDASLTQVNPPAVPTQAGPISFANQQLAAHLVAINAAGALGAGLKGSGVTIGLLDSGVNRNHPTLSGRVTQNFINVSSGANNTSVDDVIGHGTTVASIAAGRPATGAFSGGQTATWPGGVAQDAIIVSSRIISDAPPPDDGSGEGNEIHAGQGIGEDFRWLNDQLADAGARIINNSWGGLYWNDPALTTELAAGWRDFVGNRGGMIVFATGNESRTDPSDNASLPSQLGPNGSRPSADLERGWLAVTAVDPTNPYRLDQYEDDDGNIVVYPNACGVAMSYCLAAPGSPVFIDPDATSAAGGFYRGYGTSYAAPQVSGAAAVVWSAFPYFNNDQVRQTILGAAKDIGAAGVDPVFGWGLLDVTKAANGPSNFAWGDFSVSLTGNSVWRNPIVGSGGLVKNGTGTLTLAETAAYTGETRVQGGGLDVRKGLTSSNLSISSGAKVWASGTFGGSVSNSGAFFNSASAPATIAGNYSQSSTGNFGVWLGSRLSVNGTASLAGQASILGVKSGYTTTAKETLLTANGGVSGTFSSLKSAPNVFLDASLAYDTNNVFLNINRIDVTQAIAGASLSGITVASAVRVEEAMQAIDGQLSGELPGGIGGGFIGGAGALQQITSMAHADAALRSLSGELHAAADAQGFGNIDAHRRALSSRFGALAAQPRLQGDWSQSLNEPGQGNTAAGKFQNDGWLMGSDVRLGANAAAGFAFGETTSDGYLGTGRDRSHDRQTQAQFYAGAIRGNAYALGQLGTGRYERQLRRDVLLGDRREGVATDYAGDFFTANIEAGYRLDHADAALTPYAGVDYVRLQRDGFVEDGAAGFGLKANASVAERTQAIAGLRAERGWRFADGRRIGLHGFAEWQHSLSESGLLYDASFVGAESWSPLYGEGFARSSGLFGFGLDAALSRNATWSFGYDQRFGSAFDDRQWSTKLRYGF